MIVKVLENEEALNFFINDSNYKYITDRYLYFDEWKNQKNIKAYLLFENDILKSYALISKLDHDPVKIHKTPFYFNYIHTLKEYRRKGHAYYLVSHIKNNEEITVFCTDDIIQNLFKKAGYNMHSHDSLYNSLPIYRSP